MKRFQFPTLPCLVVTAIVAVLLAIGFTMPIMAEASRGGGSTIVEPVTGPGISAGVLDLEKQIILADKIGMFGSGLWPYPPKAKIALRDEMPGLPRPDPEDQLSKAKIAGLSRKAHKPDGPSDGDGVGGYTHDHMGYLPGNTTKVAGIKWGGGVLSPKPPRSDEGGTNVPVQKPKAKIVLLGGGIGRDY